MNNVTVKRMSTNEACVSLRHISYDIYVNGQYYTTRNDVCDAMELKEELEKQTSDTTLED